jgi:hypothetical protein
VVPRQRRLCRAATHGKEKVDGNADFSRSEFLHGCFVSVVVLLLKGYDLDTTSWLKFTMPFHSKSSKSLPLVMAF